MTDIAEIGHKLTDMSNMSTGDTVDFLEQIRLFYKDVKFHSEINKKGDCKNAVIEGFTKAMKERFGLDPEKTRKIITQFYDDVYSKSAS